MLFKKFLICFLILACCLLVNIIAFGAIPEASEMEKQAYRQELARIETLRKSFTPGPTNDLKKYEKFADEIQNKWKEGNKEYYARLMLEVCGPLSSGNFKDDRRYELARKYALLAVAEPNEISLETELNLIGHAITLMIGRNSPKGEKWAQLRKKDVEIRLHAWNRLLDTIDPNWDPNEVLWSPNAIGADMGLPAGGIAPESIKDLTLRAEYEAALQRNREKSERYTKQSRLHKWLKRFPPRAERYIVRAYSKVPFNLEELKQYLDNYIADEKTKARIVDAVTKNIEKQTKDIPKGSKKQNR